MSDDEERPEIDTLNDEITQLKEVLAGVKSAEATHDEACGKIADYVASKGEKDGFLAGEPQNASVNPYHTKQSGGGGGGGDDGCCTAS